MTEVNPNTKAARRAAPKRPASGLQIVSELVSPDDVSTLEGLNDVPGEMRTAARALLELATAATGKRGPFEFGDGAETARQVRATFSNCRALLDFLEAIYLQRERDELARYRATVAAFEELNR